jgi:hypothetical protein
MYHPDKYPYVWGHRHKEKEEHYEYEEINGFLRIKRTEETDGENGRRTKNQT